MDVKNLMIEGIPAILWGAPSDKLFIAVHGDQSHKADDVIAIFAEQAAEKGCRTLSFDLPGHGERSGETRLCKPQNATEDLKRVMEYARSVAGRVSLFGCSVGAYFGMLAFADEPLRQALFLSPVVDMARIIRNMMTWFDVSEERLRREGEIETPAQTLYWDYYQYVLEHPVEWNVPTAILYGGADELCEYEYVKAFAGRSHADMTVLEGGEHYFHTDAQLSFLRQWLQAKTHG